MKVSDFVGKRFGKLTVQEDSGQRKGNSVLWLCRCDCGGTVLAVRSRLVSGAIQDCGCSPKPVPQKVTDLIGRRFGLLTVEADSGQRTGDGVILWRCKCDCGGEKLATRQQLKSGCAVNCGCVPRQYASKGQAEDLTGRQFGELTVLHRAPNDKDNRVCWVCRCSCGRETTLRALALKSGHNRSCGCKRYEGAYHKRDLTGKRFGRLTVLYRSEEKNGSLPNAWHCRCDCGKEVDVLPGNLLQGFTKSCGCWGREQSTKMHEHMHYQDNTCVEILKRSCTGTSGNKAGFRGLFLMKNGKYRASITFQGKHYTLGRYDSFEMAVQARVEAEEALHVGYVRAFERYEEREKAEPDWAEQNPFFYQVMRVNGEFQIQTNA